MKRFLALVLALVLMSSFVAISAATGEEEQKLYFYAWTNPDNMVELTEAFNAEYEGKYELVYQKMADAQTLTINTTLASGEKIDVMTQASAFDLRNRADSGAYLPLNEFFDAWGKTYGEVLGESTEATQNINGNYYSVPYCRNIQFAWINKKLFDEAGVAYPSNDWTWSDFREIAKQLTKGEGANKVYGAMADFKNEYWWLPAQQKMGNFWYYNEDRTATRFDDPAVKESLQLWYDMVMVDQSIVPMDEYLALKYESDTNGMIGLYNDKYAMWLAPVYGCLYLKNSYGEVPEGTDLMMVNFPRPDGATENITTQYTSTCSIPANVEDKEAAWTLLKYICFDHPEYFAGPKAMHPGFEFADAEAATAFDRIIFEGKPGLDVEASMATMALSRKIISQDNTIVQGQGKINDLLKSNASLVFNGEMSVDECIADLKEKGDAYIAADLK